MTSVVRHEPPPPLESVELPLAELQVLELRTLVLVSFPLQSELLTTGSGVRSGDRRAHHQEHRSLRDAVVSAGLDCRRPPEGAC